MAAWSTSKSAGNPPGMPTTNVTIGLGGTRPCSPSHLKPSSYPRSNTSNSGVTARARMRTAISLRQAGGLS
jgi:hypothetical protein